jgi:aminoglycoside phosphotransferase (APT) family kinase protein
MGWVLCLSRLVGRSYDAISPCSPSESPRGVSREAVLERASLASRLAEYLRDVHGDERPVVLGDRISGGWSVNTYALAVGGQPMVLRITGDDHPLGTSPAREARILGYAEAAAVPVPMLIYAEDDPDWLGGAFALVTYVPGTAPNVWSRRQMQPFIERDGGTRLVTEVVDISIRITDIPVEGAASAPPSLLGMSPRAYSVSADVERWLGLLEGTTRLRPVLMAGGRWLLDNAPATDRVVFQHHDFRIGNLLFASSGEATAVLDWEFSGAGDPLCDLGYAAQPYTLGRLLSAQPALRLGRDPTRWMLDAYADRFDIRPDHARMRYFVALGTFKMAVALALTADEWWRGRGGLRDKWLELPILSLGDDLIGGIRSAA